MLRLRNIATAFSAASRELARLIEQQAHPAQGWTLENWGRSVSREVEAARVRRDEAATEYRAELLAVRRALVGRPAGHALSRVELNAAATHRRIADALASEGA